MDIPKELSFSLFLMLMLFKTAVSVPVENNNQFLNVQSTTEFSYESLVKTNKTLIELFPYLSTLMLMLFKTVVSVPVENNTQFINVKPTAELSFETLVKTNKTLIELFPYLSTQPYANFTGQLRSLAKQELTYAMGSIKNITDFVNSAVERKKLLIQSFNNDSSLFVNIILINRDLLVAKIFIKDLEILINSPETDNKFNDLLAALPDKESKKTFKALAESFKKFAYQELKGVKAKFDDLESQISHEINITIGNS